MSNTWVVRTPDDDPSGPDALFKLSTAAPLLAFDFGDFDELDADGSTLTGTPTVTASPSGLTLTGAALVPDADDLSYRVQVRVAGGTGGNEYELTCTTVTAAGDTLVGKGKLLVR